MHKAGQSAQDGGKQGTWEGLDFIEDDDAAGGPVELPASAGAVCVKGFEKADVGGDDDGRIPVF